MEFHIFLRKLVKIINGQERNESDIFQIKCILFLVTSRQLHKGMWSNFDSGQQQRNSSYPKATWF